MTSASSGVDGCLLVPVLAAPALLPSIDAGHVTEPPKFQLQWADPCILESVANK